MDQLPNEVLWKIFSNLSPFQLLRVEQVCPQWQRVIQNEYWNGLEFITEETIDHPNGDYLNNFIRLSSHLVEVKEFINPFTLMKDFPSHYKVEGELFNATLQLVYKLSADALFPLNVIPSIVSYQLNRMAQPSMAAKGTRTPLISKQIESIIQDTIDDFLILCRASMFCSFRINSVFIHNNEKDPFVIRWRGAQVPVPIVFKKAIRLVIGCLEIRLDGNSLSLHPEVKTLNGFSNMTLKFIDIENIHLSVYPDYDGQEPTFDILLQLNDNRHRFSMNDFKCLLETLSEKDRSKRNLNMIECIKQWHNDGRVKRVEFRIAQSHFFLMKCAIVTTNKNSSLYLDDHQKSLIAQLFLSNVDVLHLTYERSIIEVDILETLAAESILLRLKSLSISFAYESDLSTNQIGLWHPMQAVSKVVHILRTIKDNLGNLECLVLRFTAGGRTCSSDFISTNSVPVMTDSLPHLLCLEYIGLPCFPFIMSVVSRAPNLRRLSIGCQPFQDLEVGLTWIIKLLDSLDVCPHLAFLQIAVQCEERLSDAERFRRKPTLFMDDEMLADTSSINKYGPLLNVVEENLQSLRNKMLNLSHLSITIDTLEYHFGTEKERKLTNWHLGVVLAEDYFKTKKRRAV